MDLWDFLEVDGKAMQAKNKKNKKQKSFYY